MNVHRWLASRWLIVCSRSHENSICVCNTEHWTHRKLYENERWNGEMPKSMKSSSSSIKCYITILYFVIILNYKYTDTRRMFIMKVNSNLIYQRKRIFVEQTPSLYYNFHFITVSFSLSDSVMANMILRMISCMTESISI